MGVPEPNSIEELIDKAGLTVFDMAVYEASGKPIVIDGLEFYPEGWLRFLKLEDTPWINTR